MGIFSRKPKPAFSPPELPLSNVQDPARRGSVMDQLRASFAIESPFPTYDKDGNPVFQGAQQSTFLGRKLSQAIVPQFARRAGPAQADLKHTPGRLLAGEKGAEDLGRSFFASRLSLDNPSDDEKQPRLDKGKGRMITGRGWQGQLGWAEPKRPSSAAKELKKRKRKSKRGMKIHDDDLHAFNTYTQNGLTPTRSRDSFEPSIHCSMLSKADVESVLIVDDDSSRAVLVGDGFDALDVMADHIFRLGAQKKKWFKAPKMGARGDEVGTGVTIRARPGLYRTFPVNYPALDTFQEAITRLNPEIAIKIKSSIVGTIMTSYINPTPSMSELLIDANTRIQILDDISHLARARKHQYAAFVRSEQVLCVWADHVEAVIPAAEALEEALIQFIWQGEEENKKINQAMVVDEEEEEFAESDDPEDITLRQIQKHWRERPTMLNAPISDGCAIIVCMMLIALGLRALIKGYLLDGKAMRFILFIFCLPLFAISSFACMCLVGSLFQCFGPVRQVTSKSLYYSGVAPKRTMGELSHVTVQLPVYKESLEDVIMPTIESLKRAITTYERQGGSVGILICDDGLQLLDQAEADKRRQFYYNNNIAYVARPGHNVDGFQRKGRFKKAGNMNFANALSLRVEEIMDDLRPVAKEAAGEDHYWADIDENLVYDAALAQGIEESKGKAWAEGNIRFGPIILIIDSDTRVPEDCFADAVSEMAESPEVAIIQHASGVMQVAHHFFENGVAHFTKGIQVAISYVCASGEVAPFVGHNAFIRWSALQECLSLDSDDGVMKIWSEAHVSEDFQIALTLQCKGYIVRWASYSGGEFEEGVSLTCDDEMNRWQKYAFGCSELLFHPLKYWFTKGPVTPLFRQFVYSPIPLHSKFTISGYIFSYYAIGCAWLLTFANYFIEGWELPVDGYYLGSWDVSLVCIVLFVGICNVAFIVLRYRLKLPDSAKTCADQIKWIPFFCIFFVGMSMPMSAALAAHLVGYNMTWSSTVKTVQKSNFFLQIPLIWKRFWPQLCFFTFAAAVMIVTSLPIVPPAFRIKNVEVQFPLGMAVAAHLLWPFALNPWFLSFSF